MDEKKTHPDLVKAVVRGEIIADEIVPELADAMLNNYIDFFKNDPELRELSDLFDAQKGDLSLEFRKALIKIITGDPGSSS